MNSQANGSGIHNSGGGGDDDDGSDRAAAETTAAAATATKPAAQTGSKVFTEWSTVWLDKAVELFVRMKQRQRRRREQVVAVAAAAAADAVVVVIPADSLTNLVRAQCTEQTTSLSSVQTSFTRSTRADSLCLGLFSTLLGSETVDSYTRSNAGSRWLIS